MQHTLLLGAHISIAGGFDQAIVRGESIGCTAIQIFTKSNRQWTAAPIGEDAIIAFKNARKHSSITQVIAHAAYLINIGSPHEHIRTKSTQAVIDELHRCHQLGIPYLVMHPGAHGTEPINECLTRIAEQINHILTIDTGTTTLVLETMAGQGTNVCDSFEQLAYIYQQVTHKKRFGICFDTCHVFAAGYDLQTKEAYNNTWKIFDNILGRDLLKVIHLNDSKKPLGMHVDRHEDIGKGKLGLDAFKFIMNDSRLFDIPKILETPKESLRDDWRNMRTLADLVTTENRRVLKIDIPEALSEAKSK